MGTERISGPQKAAILLYSLGEDLASAIVRSLDEEEIKKIGTSMAKISSISPKTAESIFSEFHQLASSGRPIQLGADGKNQFIKNLFSKAMEGEKAQVLFEKIEEEGKWNLFKKVRRLDPRTLASFIKNEHPQTIAVVLAHLDSGQAAAILGEFPDRVRTEVLYRIAQLENVPSAILEEMDQSLQEEISMLENLEGGKLGGIRSVAEILNQMDSSAESTILQSMDEQQQGLGDEIRRLMFVFEDLAQVEDRSMMAILKEINSETLKIALKTASDGLKEKIFKNMSERAGQMLKEDLELMGPARLKDVEAAQQMIIKTAKKLESEGKIVIAGKGKEDVFV
ncbi:MAG: flagellar motor switch protein FliG [Deltaproteobacteria bacterium]|nr:flagellar motor switch protein FliG [Deltaproteobacteria bacterium]